jgi:C1A family cysteine protease
MKKLFFCAFYATSAFASTYEAVSTYYDFQSAPEYQAILAQLKSYGEYEAKDAPPIEKLKTLSRGEQMVEEAKARNRALLAERDKAEKAQKSDDSITELDKWKLEERQTLKSWKKESQDLLQAWKREQEIFLGRLKIYKENTFIIPAPKEKIIEMKIPVEALPQAQIVNATFKVPIKDQGSRPTCVAFAGNKALEILLAQHNIYHDLSEQYLYWAGKPQCQKAPCTEKGSWILGAFRHSQQQPFVDIPSEESCAYRSDPVEKNETQLPLGNGCKKGVSKVVSFQEVKTIADLVDLLKKNIPVVIAAKLSDNFYKNRGVITLADAASRGAKDMHYLGHAFLAVGLIELPIKLKASEGDFCIVVANSWGKGWGAGGYACITQKWFEKYRQPAAFIAPIKVATNE